MNNLSRTLWQAYEEVPEQVILTMLDQWHAARDITYRELLHNAAGTAVRLQQAGITGSQVVVLILPHGPELIGAFFGAILNGSIPAIMPFLTEKLSPDHYWESLGALVEITTPAAVITYQDFFEPVQAVAQRSASIRKILLAEELSPVKDLTPALLPGLESSSDTIVLLQHSSGTTGLQKGVALSHQAVFNQLASYSKALRLSPSDVIVSWLPLYHDMGLIAGFILPILQRIRLVLMSPFDWVRAPYKLLQAISTYRGTLTWLPNFAYNFCAQKIRQRDLERVDLTSLRAAINCSEPMHWDSHQMFLERFQPYNLKPSALATCYAMAENVFAVTQGGIDAPVTIDEIDLDSYTRRGVAEPTSSGAASRPVRSLKMLSAGRPIENTLVRIQNTKGHNLPDRTIGEIALQSDCLLTGYYHRPELTPKIFQDGWYLTGDLGYLAEGELYVTGRKKDLLIIGGKNIFPEDLERLAGEVNQVHPGRVAAFGIYNEITGTEDAVLAAELDEFENLNEDELESIASAIRTRVTRGTDIALRHVHLCSRGWLIKTTSGKLSRSAIRDKYLQLIQPS